MKIRGMIIVTKQIIQVVFREKNKEHITEVDIYTYDVVNGERFLRNRFKGHGGKSGLAIGDKKEGDYKTPWGVYDLPLVFGTEIVENSNIIQKKISRDDVWVDDAKSLQYNTMQKRENLQADSWEELYIPAYKHVIVVGYNYETPVPGKGSAIFIHLKTENKYTAGCIALDEEDLIEIIKWLDFNKNPIIIIL